jgi:hypothetical protein
MSTIIAGRFGSASQARAVLVELSAACFEREEFASYYVNPPGQHGLHPLVGDDHADAGAAIGAITGGAAAIVLGGMAGLAAAPAGATVAGEVGAYVETLLRSLSRVEDCDPKLEVAEKTAEAGAGPMVAICVDRPGTEQVARAALHRHGAHTIELQKGCWEQGDWKDFEPGTPAAALQSS